MTEREEELLSEMEDDLEFGEKPENTSDPLPKHTTTEIRLVRPTAVVTLDSEDPEFGGLSLSDGMVSVAYADRTVVFPTHRLVQVETRLVQDD